ncbi:MAG: hypothetical protein WAW07_12315, partial [Bacteroidales bacterium]
MIESKKKPVKNEKVEIEDDGLKTAKKIKARDSKEKPVTQGIDEEILPEVEDALLTGEEELVSKVVDETEEVVREARIRKNIPEIEKEIKS